MIALVLKLPWQVSAGLCAVSLVVAFVVMPLLGRQTTMLAVLEPAGRLVLLFLAVVFGFIALVRSLAREHDAVKAAQGIERSSVFWEERRKHRRNLPAVDVDFAELSPAPGTETFAEAEPGQWSLELLESLDRKRFEKVVAAYFRENNFRCETVAYGGDGGVDARLFFRDEPTPVGVVRCKAWGTRQVGVAPVRELLGVMVHENVKRGYFAATGDFSDEAIRFAAAHPIKLISGTDFMSAIVRMDADRSARLLAASIEGDDTVAARFR